MSETAPSDHCNHFVMRKKRYCRISVKPGDKFCGEHLPPSEGGSDEKIRIVCPFDRKHTCYAHNLAKHLKICNARPGLALPYIKKGVNSGETDEGHKLLSEFSTTEIKELVLKINKIYGTLTDDIVDSRQMSHNIVETEILKPEHGDKSRKHLKQASAILGLLSENGLLKKKCCFIEFGAGRGQLSFWLAQIIDACFLLVERSSPKHKKDNKLENSDVQRIRADIADLVLDNVEAVSKCDNVVGVTKHLCGDATDLALRCLANLGDKTKFTGCIMTFCCHHRCRWGSYTGKSFFQNLGLTKAHFEMMCSMGSWATCGTGYSREKNQQGLVQEPMNDRDKEIGLNRLEKQEIGGKCKHILNLGRFHFLQDLGFQCNLHYYVGSEVSLENVCIVAK